MWQYRILKSVSQTAEFSEIFIYRKFPKDLDTPKKCYNYPKTETESWTEDAYGMANTVDPDQTGSSLIWAYTACPDLSVCSDLSVRKLRIITVNVLFQKKTSVHCGCIHACHKLWTEICEIRKIFKGD